MPDNRPRPCFFSALSSSVVSFWYTHRSSTPRRYSLHWWWHRGPRQPAVSSTNLKSEVATSLHPQPAPLLPLTFVVLHIDITYFAWLMGESNFFFVLVSCARGLDGGWGGHGLRGERCHVSAKLGPGWNYEYKVKWEMLPVIISRALHEQLAKNNQPSRLVEVSGGRTLFGSGKRRGGSGHGGREGLRGAVDSRSKSWFSLSSSLFLSLAYCWSYWSCC